MRRALALGLGAIVACSSEGRRAPAPTEVPPVASENDATARLVRSLKAPNTLVRTDAGLRLSLPNARLAVSLPRASNGEITIAVAASPRHSLRIRPLDVQETEAKLDDGVVVHRGAIAFGDVVFAAGGDWLEELRVLHSDRAKASTRHRIEPGEGIAAVRLREGYVEAIDETGYVRLVSPRPFARDARGVERKMHVTLAYEDGAYVVSSTLDTAGLDYPIVVDPAWTSTPPMSVRRSFAASAVLTSGSILVAGGADGSASTATVHSSAEIYDPTKNTWSSTGSMSIGRTRLTATRMSSARILVHGGLQSLTGARTSTAESWDPLTGTWSSEGNTAAAWASGWVMTLPTSGTVLAFGGFTYGPTTQTFRYDPTQATKWREVGSTAVLHGEGVAFALSSTRVLLAGGWADGPNVSVAEIFDTTTDKWSLAKPMSIPRGGASVVQLSPTRFLVAGGVANDIFTPTAEIYDSATASWTSVPNSKYTRHALPAPNTAFLGFGKALFPSTLGATTLTEIWDDNKGAWLASPSMTTPRQAPQVHPIGAGRAIVIGGQQGSIGLSTAEIFASAVNGATCAVDGECSSGNCIEGTCCATACVAYACAATGTCRTTCSADVDCRSDHWCDGGACKPKKKLGTTCGATRECSAPALCVDGYCCESACSGQCQACDVTPGKCTPVTGAPHGIRPACGGTGAGTACEKRCDGKTTSICLYAPPSTPCGKNSCVAGEEEHVALCNGAGTCADTKTTCGVYRCDPTGTSCLTKCASDADCIAGHYCAAGVCFAHADLGKPCTSDAACASGHCASGVCCTAACTDGSSCIEPGKVGTCVKVLGQTCASGTECASGFCVDGVCCDAACDGVCEACAEPGKKGTCRAVAGEPRGTREKCASGASACDGRTCDGVDRKSCAGFTSGPATTCTKAKCDGASFTPASVCDGKGGCRASEPVTCAPYRCNAEGCLAKCASDDDCVAGNVCDSGACLPAAKCSEDRTRSTGKTGASVSCAPYMCGPDGNCLTSCLDTKACAPGFVCDPTSSSCIAGGGATGGEDAGGCSTSPRRTHGPFALVVAGLVSLVLWRRRRRLGAPAVVAALALLVGCTSRDRSPSEAAPPSPRKLLAQFPSLPLVPVIDDAHSSKIRATLPVNAASPTRFDLGEHWVEIRALDVRAVPARIEDGIRIHRDAQPSTHLLFLRGDAAIEEVRVLVDDAAPTTFRWRVRTSPGLEVRVRDVWIEVHQAGVVRLSSPLPFAVDAKGTRRRLTVAAQTHEEETELVASLDVAGLAHPIAVDPAWSTVASMSVPRRWHTATALSDGKVLVAGGEDGAFTLSTAEIYDPDSNTWTATTSPMATRRYLHAAARLPSGDVLVVGGSGSTAAPNSIEIYRAATRTFAPVTATAAERRWEASIVPLASGHVLIVGGGDHPSCDLYNPTKNVLNDPFKPKDTLIARRNGQLAVRFTTGPRKDHVAVFSTEFSPQDRSAESWDPVANTWTALPTMPRSHHRGVITTLPDGRVLLAGSTDATAIATSDIFNPVTLTWASPSPPNMTAARAEPVIASLGLGRFLVVGGATSYTISSALSTAEVYDATTSTWLATTPMSMKRRQHAAAPLPGNRALVAGGIGVTPSAALTTSSVEIYELQKNGDSCVVGAECTSGICAGKICCATTCGPAFACTGGTCKTTCGGDVDCMTGYWCASGTCLLKKANAAACKNGNECVSGFCVDGFCCNSDCKDLDGVGLAQCAACDVPGNVGKCTAVRGAPRGGRPACSGHGVGTTCGPTCDGSDVTKCNYAPPTESCSSASCSGGVETHLSKCDGKGKCLDEPKSCGAYVCGDTSCKTACEKNADCAGGFYCEGNKCLPAIGAGAACDATKICGAGLSCVDGVCCKEASCDGGRRCDLPGARGRCAKPNGLACTSEAECASSVCVDGVCCDAACDGQCQACDAEGSVGTCVPIKGVPHGKREKCSVAGTDPLCGQLACDGAKDPMKCVAYARGPETVCHEAVCTSWVFQPKGACDGAGHCRLAAAKSCAPFACTPEGCKTSCAKKEDCAGDNLCVGGNCVAPFSCTANGLESIGADGVARSCAPYTCRSDGKCGAACAASSDCAPGAVCDPTAKTCLFPEAGNDDGGGCAFARPRANAFAFAAVLALVGALRRARRRVER